MLYYRSGFLFGQQVRKARKMARHLCVSLSIISKMPNGVYSLLTASLKAPQLEWILLLDFNTHALFPIRPNYSAFTRVKWV